MEVEIYWSHSFLPALIRKDGIVFDFGMNDGGFTRLVAGRCLKVIAFEPDPSWRGKVELPANVELHTQALAASPGRIRLNVNKETCASMHYAEAGSEMIEVEAVTMADALKLAKGSRIDLVKMDIEGEEVSVLQDAPAEQLQGIVQMTVEFHDFLDPSSTPRIVSVITRMRSLGFHAIKFSRSSHGDMLFLNEFLAPLGWKRKAWLSIRYKYIRGIWRWMKRMTGR